jgi:hypothetical protein
MNGWQVWAGDIQIIDYVLEEADARLIAAAPLLLVALKKARLTIEERCQSVGHGEKYSARETMPYLFSVIDAAIAAAEGEA